MQIEAIGRLNASIGERTRFLESLGTLTRKIVERVCYHTTRRYNN